MEGGVSFFFFDCSLVRSLCLFVRAIIMEGVPPSWEAEVKR